MSASLLEGKTVIITGAGSGIGRAAIDVFAGEGASLALADISDANSEEAVATATKYGADAIFLAIDVASRSDVNRLVQETKKRFGRIDAAFNNAGMSGPSTAAHLWDAAVWTRIVEVNLMGVWNCISAVVPHMIEQGSGSIVNTASTSGLVATAGKAPYVASKHAVVGLTKSAALDYAPAGFVNAVCPGPILTPLLEKHIETSGDPAAVEAAIVSNIPLGRMGLASEVADAAAWLCSDKSSFVTGFSIAVDGGYVAR